MWYCVVRPVVIPLLLTNLKIPWGPAETCEDMWQTALWPRRKSCCGPRGCIKSQRIILRLWNPTIRCVLSHGGIFRSVHSLNHIVWRAGKSRKDHPVGPSYFTDAGTESQGNEGAWPGYSTVSELLQLASRSLNSHFVSFHFSTLP